MCFFQLRTLMSMRDKTIIDESYPMIILKAKAVLFKPKILDVIFESLFILQNHLSFVGNKFSGSHHRLCTPSYTFMGFHPWNDGFMEGVGD